jgi:hypothetical protein
MKKSIQIWTRTVSGTENHSPSSERTHFPKGIKTIQGALDFCNEENEELKFGKWAFRYFVRETIDHECENSKF